MKPASRPQPDLPTIYRRLLTAFGPQHWWPAETPFEVMVGAILTQNAAWSNVERAIANLKRARKLNPRAILALSNPGLQRLIRPSGFFRVKAKRLRAFADYFVTRYQGSIARMRREPLARLRPELLRVHGIGPETADSILLYALNKPSFVIDAYTRRMLERHGMAARTTGYEDLRAMFEDSLPRRVQLYNEYHALFVRLAKTHCRTRPLCDGCPLSAYRMPPPHSLPPNPCPLPSPSFPILPAAQSESFCNLHSAICNLQSKSTTQPAASSAPSPTPDPCPPTASPFPPSLGTAPTPMASASLPASTSFGSRTPWPVRRPK